MRFEKINENKLKITLSNDELPYSTNLDGFITNSEEARDAFIGMLDKAEEEVGFHAHDFKIKIDARSNSNGEYVFTVTKLVNIKSNKVVVKPKKVSTVKKEADSTYTIYQFNCFDDFCEFCEFLKTSKLDNIQELAESFILYSFGHYYYLSLKNVNDNYDKMALFASSVTEFSKFFSSKDLLIATLQERGKVFIEDNAIITCQNYFC